MASSFWVWSNELWRCPWWIGGKCHSWWQETISLLRITFSNWTLNNSWSCMLQSYHERGNMFHDSCTFHKCEIKWIPKLPNGFSILGVEIVNLKIKVQITNDVEIGPLKTLNFFWNENIENGFSCSIWRFEV
jgi:hypothetical protein